MVGIIPSDYFSFFVSHHPEQHNNDEISAESLTSFSRPTDRLLNSHFTPKEMGPTAFIIPIAHRGGFFFCATKKKVAKSPHFDFTYTKKNDDKMSLASADFLFVFPFLAFPGKLQCCPSPPKTKGEEERRDSIEHPPLPTSNSPKLLRVHLQKGRFTLHKNSNKTFSSQIYIVSNETHLLYCKTNCINIY